MKMLLLLLGLVVFCPSFAQRGKKKDSTLQEKVDARMQAWREQHPKAEYIDRPLKLEVNEIDKFTKQKRLETSEYDIVYTDQTRLAVAIRTVGNSYFIIFAGFGHGPEIIGLQGVAVLLLENDSTITLKSTGSQIYTTTYSTKSYKHQYYLTSDDLKKISANKCVSVRRYGLDGYVDIDIPVDRQERIKEAAALILINL